MGTVILLSSSPPRPFAHSPTPATSSSPTFASPSSIFGNGHRRFKTAPVDRDGFAGGFSTTRRILGTKFGSENLPFGVSKVQQISGKPSKELIADTESEACAEADGGRSEVRHTKSSGIAATLVKDQAKEEPTELAAREAPVEAAVTSVFVTEADVLLNSRPLSPLLLDKAPSRRLDWTPPRGQSGNAGESGSPRSPSRTSFLGGLLENFGYEGGYAQSSFDTQHKDEGAPTKRRKLDLIDHNSRKPLDVMAAPKPASGAKASITAPKKRSKAPKKRLTTITALATSKYVGEEARPMLEYLEATQARHVGETDKSLLGISREKSVPKKSKAKKKSLPKSVLLSPVSAMKAVDSQDVVFGSASQLALDESPTCIRDTVEATKQSESSISCTPVTTQITVPSEPGSATPRGLKGTSRFTRFRNLWASASRDEDNALLQVETIDLFDSPHLRLAFTGKDAMLQPVASRDRQSKSPERASAALRGGHLGRTTFAESNGWLDIDEISTETPRAHMNTKPFTQIQSMHTTSEPPDTRAECLSNANKVRVEGTDKNALADKDGVMGDASVSVSSGHSAEEPKVQMPLFSGFTTTQLSDQLKKYGFKPIKKRDKMIERLQSCWEAKHQLTTTSSSKVVAENELQDEEVDVATHGDILSKVHGLAARPVPKVPKPKVPRAKKDKPETSAKAPRRRATLQADEDVEKTPKPRRQPKPKTKKPEQPATESDKQPRKRATKASALSEKYVIDISDIEDTTFETHDKAHVPMAVACAEPVRDTALQSIPRPVTPPPTLLPRISSKLGSSTPKPLETAIPTLPDINSQITAAITKYVASPSRDHQRDPTWHEKILIYDPVVLEDLAAWLNTEGLGLIGEDREVSALEVRAWCEMKGVCCYGVGGGWRGNLKGKG